VRSPRVVKEFLQLPITKKTIRFLAEQ
jgi:hypothetical protein